MSGCAGDVMDPTAARDGGSVGKLGKSIGEVNGLEGFSPERTIFHGTWYLRIIKVGHLGKIVDYRILVWPLQTGWISFRSTLNILGAVFEDEVSISLILLEISISHNPSSTYLRKAVSIKNKSM